MKKILIFGVLILSFLSFDSVSANGGDPENEIGGANCQAPYYIPNACPAPYRPGISGGYTADLNCQLQRITSPGTRCCPNICVNADGSRQSGTLPGEGNPELFRSFEVFNTTIRVNPDNIGTIINILFTTVLGFVSLYAIVRGIYVTGVKRTMVSTPDEIAAINQELTNLVIGAIICWGFIIIIQVIANLIGVGQLSNLDISGGDTGGVVITIK